MDKECHRLASYQDRELEETPIYIFLNLLIAAALKSNVIVSIFDQLH